MKAALILSLATACLTYLGLSHWMPESSSTGAAAPVIQARELETVQVSRPKYLSSKHLKSELSHGHSKPRAELEQTPAHVVYAETAPIVLHSSEIDFSLQPSIIILPKTQLTQVAPLFLQKRNPS